MAKYKHWNGTTKFKSSWGFMLNDGGGPLNCTVIWGSPSYRFFFYVFLLGRRWSYMIHNKGYKSHA